MTSKTKAALLASALLVMPAAATAQEVTEQANAVAETAQQLQQEANALSNAVSEDEGRDREAGDTAAADTRDERDGDDDSGKWGLLGLLGLAGLLGLKRRDRDDHRHVDVDARRSTGGTTGTRTGTGNDRL
jgi:MYXO-CTERM domain-containing protein